MEHIIIRGKKYPVRTITVKRGKAPQKVCRYKGYDIYQRFFTKNLDLYDIKEALAKYGNTVCRKDHVIEGLDEFIITNNISMRLNESGRFYELSVAEPLILSEEDQDIIAIRNHLDSRKINQEAIFANDKRY